MVKNLDKIRTPGVVVNDGEYHYYLFANLLTSTRAARVKYSQTVASDMDGVIEAFRRGVPDLDLGRSTYAQVRALLCMAAIITKRGPWLCIPDDLLKVLMFDSIPIRKEHGNKSALSNL